jgi:hypothetical protein
VDEVEMEDEIEDEVDMDRRPELDGRGGPEEGRGPMLGPCDRVEREMMVVHLDLS